MALKFVDELPTKRVATGPRGLGASKYDETIKEIQANPNRWAQVDGPRDKMWGGGDALKSRGGLVVAHRSEVDENGKVSFYAFAAYPSPNSTGWDEFVAVTPANLISSITDPAA